MADHQTTQVHDHEHAEDEAQPVLTMQHGLVAEDSPLVAEDSGLAPQAQCVPPTQQVMVAEDNLLAGKILHILPT
jgi:hypothetical protein